MVYTSARAEKAMALMEPGEVMDQLALPAGLAATPIDVGRRPRIVKDGEGYVIKLGRKTELPLLTTEGRDSLFQFAGVPKGLAQATPERLIMPVLEHALGAKERVIAISDQENGLIRLQPPQQLKPTMGAEQVLERIQQQFPEVLYQRAETGSDFSCDLLAITHNHPERLEELLQPGQHKFLPRGGDPFRAGVHVRFSPVGTAEPLVEPYMVRLVCLNGAVHAEFLTPWGRGYGEGDELWQWFREGLAYSNESVQGIMGQYANLVGEVLPRGEGRMLAVEGMIRNARLPRDLADAVRAQAIANPPRTQYDVFNLLTAAATHNSRSFGEQLRRMTVAGHQAEEGHHHGFCPTCRRN